MVDRRGKIIHPIGYSQWDNDLLKCKLQVHVSFLLKLM